MRNKNLLLLGSLVTLSFITVTLIKPTLSSTASVYEPRNTEEPAKTNADQAMEYYKSKRINPATGLYDPLWLKQTRDQVLAENRMQLRASTLAWIEQGPDNVGGRTRAICIDRNDPNHVLVGSVSGGLFVSTNAGNTWTAITSFTDSLLNGLTSDYLRVSSMCQTLDGTYYVGTGCSFDNWNGDGIWKSTDNGATWVQITNSANWSNVNEMRADPIIPDKIWIAGQNSSGGAQTYTPTGGFAAINGLTGTTYYDLQVSVDGQVIIAGKLNSGNVQTWVSTDAGANFSNVSGSGATQVPTSGNTRMEYAISFDKNDDNKYNVYASGTSGDLNGVWMSEDNGLTWTEIAPSSSAQFDPFISRNGQGSYDQILSCVPDAPGQLLLGGIDIYKWVQEPNLTPTFGQWYQKTLWFASEFSPIYAHADQHEMEWDQNDILYIGNDGGVGKSFDRGENVWIPHNRGYNVTQFYSVAYNKYGHSMGGAQDNGTQYKNFTGVTAEEYEEVMGGDGFDCDISHINTDVMFATVYNGDFNRSDDEGSSWAFFGPIASTETLPFHSVGRLYENMNDTDSQDSVMYIANGNMAVGDTIFYVSRTQQIDLTHILTAPLADGDTISLQDPVQSLFAVGYFGNNGVYITRHALRFNVTPTWKEVVPSVSGQVTCIEFAANGEVMYVGTSAGTLYVVENLNTFYSPANDESGVTVTTITGFGSISGIAVDPQDADHVVVCGNSNARESVSATTATTTASFPLITSSLTDMPIYDAVIDHLDPNTILLGTEYGMYVSTNGGTSWSAETGAGTPGLVPVEALRQQWRTDSWNCGVVYAGTFGRGIWSTASLVGINEPDATAVNQRDITKVSTYPNPMTTQGTVSFTINERSKVAIYVMDLTGKVVLTKDLGELNKGENSTSINVEGLASGTYIVTIKAGDQIGTDKLVVTR